MYVFKLIISAYFFVPQRRQISIAEVRRILAEKRIDACGGAVKKPENMHERGFARARRPHNRHKLSLWYGEGEVVEDGSFHFVVHVSF